MSHNKPRLKLEDTVIGSVMAFCGGNPGAMTALMKMINEIPKHDPDSMLGAFGPLISLDNLDIYEENIWMLYKDVCGYSTLKCAILFRANQLGFVPGAAIKKATMPTTFDFAGLLARIQEEVPNFGKAGLEVPA